MKSNTKCSDAELNIIKSKYVDFDKYSKINNKLCDIVYNEKSMTSTVLEKKSVVNKRLIKNFITRKYVYNATIEVVDDDYSRNPRSLPDDYLGVIYKYFLRIAINNISRDVTDDDKLIKFIKDKYVAPDSIIVAIINSMKMYRVKKGKVKKSTNVDTLILSNNSIIGYKNGLLELDRIGKLSISNIDESIVSNCDILKIEFINTNDHGDYIYHIKFGECVPIRSSRVIYNLSNDEYIH